MKTPFLPLLAVVPVAAALTLGTPVPRVVQVGADTCETLCRSVSGASACTGVRACRPAPAECGSGAIAAATVPAADPDAPDPSGDASEDTITLCVYCQCGLGEIGPPPRIQEPQLHATDYSGDSVPLDSVERAPASPPPRLA
ncbi:MAG TPA: hypothetical protein VKU85_07275 [bacterium]|nr:hypothetical protein [bacterium]